MDLNEEKEIIRVKIKTGSELINLKGLSEKLEINYANVRNFMSGRLNYLSIDKAKQILSFIDYVNTYFNN